MEIWKYGNVEYENMWIYHGLIQESSIPANYLFGAKGKDKILEENSLLFSYLRAEPPPTKRRKKAQKLKAPNTPV